MPPLQALIIAIVNYGVLLLLIIGMAMAAYCWLKNIFGGGDDLNNDS